MKHSVLSVLGVMSLSVGLLLAGGAAARKPEPMQKPASVKSTSSKVRNITIIAVEGKISPDVIRVRRGDLVRLTFKSKDGTYGVKIPALNVKGKATPERPVYVEFAATSEGEYEMRCTKFWGVKHWSENGKIIVE